MKNILCIIFLCFVTSFVRAQTLPGESGTKPAIDYDYFPSRMHAFIWRNWTVVPKEKLAGILGTSSKNVKKVARSMGLPKQGKIQPEWSTSRGYITVLRRNWHLLPYAQLLDLLEISREEPAFRLIEDDFLFIKLGSVKPFCEPLKYQEPPPEMNRRSAVIASNIKDLGKDAFAKETPRFSFVKEFRNANPIQTTGKSSNLDGFDLRMIYSYFADFGDPLLDTELTAYPEGLLQRLSLALSTYGANAAPDVRKAWKLCSDAFREYPYHIQTVYNGPQQVGPANPFYLRPTGYPSTMVGFPYDAVDTWRAVYPVPVYVSQLEKCADGFFKGAALLKETQKKAKGEFAEKLETERLRMEVVGIHLRSVAEQSRFTDARNRYLSADSNETVKKNCIAEMRQAAQKELELIKSLLPLVKKDATIGYESSNHYFYLPVDLDEAYISIHRALEWINTL